MVRGLWLGIWRLHYRVWGLECWLLFCRFWGGCRIHGLRFRVFKGIPLYVRLYLSTTTTAMVVTAVQPLTALTTSLSLWQMPAAAAAGPAPGAPTVTLITRLRLLMSATTTTVGGGTATAAAPDWRIHDSSALPYYSVIAMVTPALRRWQTEMQLRSRPPTWCCLMSSTA